MPKRPARFGDYSEDSFDVSLDRPDVEARDEGLTGFVRGEPASDLEERLANSMKKYRIGFQFQFPVYTAHSFPGHENKVDFLVKNRQPLDVFGFVGHYMTSGQPGFDKLRENRINERLREQGLPDLKVVPYTDILTPESADLYVQRELADV